MSWRSIFRKIFFIGFFSKVFFSYWTPLTPDEAYYIHWSKSLDWGYFDHPPAISMLAMTSYIDSSAFWARLGCLVIYLLSFIGLGRLYFLSCRGDAQPDQNISTRVIALFLLSIGGLIYGWLITPDVPLTCAWIWALAEAALALRGRQWRWLSCGLFVGLGLLSKYTMVLIFPVLWFAIFFGDRKQLRSAWPYAGFFLALLVFSPHIYWNDQHQWISFRFQAQHGLKDSHEVEFDEINHLLPQPQKAIEGDKEYAIGSYFSQINKHKPLQPAQVKVSSPLRKSVQSFTEFFLSQLVMLGFFILAFVFAAWKQRKTIRNAFESTSIFYRECVPLLILAFVFPLAFFAIISCFTKVEANWASMFLPSFCVLGGPWLRIISVRSMLTFGMLNVLAVFAVIQHAHRPWLPIDAGKDRISRETQGYDHLGERITSIAEDDPVFFARYQIGAMLHFYAPQIMAAQWPGLSRNSEYTRRSSWYVPAVEMLEQKKTFWVIAGQLDPAKIPGFQVTKAYMLQNCRGEGIFVIDFDRSKKFVPHCSETELQSWTLAKYIITEE